MTPEVLDRHVQQALGQRAAVEQQVAKLATEVEALTAERDLLLLTSGALQALLQQMSAEQLGTIEQIVTYGLRSIFDDQQLGFRLNFTVKRGVQWVEPVILQGDKEAPILDATGGGPASVVSFLLRLLACQRLKLAPVLLLDEPFAMVSAEYRANVGKLLRELVDQLGITILMVTHEPGLQDFAHVTYEARETADGTEFVRTGVER